MMPCPIGETGWSVIVEAFHPAGGRLYGDLNYGDALYGDQPGSGDPDWQEITTAGVGMRIVRGDELGEISPPVGSITGELYDPTLSAFDFAAPASFFDPDTGSPFRVAVLGPDLGAGRPRYDLATGVIDRVLVEHGAGPRLVELEAFDVLSQLVTPLRDWQAITTTLADRVDELVTAAQPVHRYGEQIAAEVAGRALVADVEADDRLALDEVRVAAASAGATVDTDPAGTVRIRRWPLGWSADGAIHVADCRSTTVPDATIDAAASRVGYVMDLETILNRVELVHRSDPQLDTVVTDPTSVAVYSPRSEALGFPLRDLVYANVSDAIGDAGRYVDRFAGLVKRPWYFDADTRTDPRWLAILADLDVGDPVVIHRYGYPSAVLDHRAVVVGLDHELSRDGWSCRVFVSSIEPTIGAAP